MIIPPKNFPCGALVAGRGHRKRLTDSGILKKTKQYPWPAYQNKSLHIWNLFFRKWQNVLLMLCEKRLTVKPEDGEKNLFLLFIRPWCISRQVRENKIFFFVFICEHFYVKGLVSRHFKKKVFQQYCWWFKKHFSFHALAFWGEFSDPRVRNFKKKSRKVSYYEKGFFFS